MSLLATVTGLFALVREGKKTVDEVLNDPATDALLQETQDQFRRQVEAETTNGNAFTRCARPALIYVAVLALANDLLIAPYMELWAGKSVVILSEQKFGQLMAMLSALGLARSVFDKQGSWLSKWLAK